jgi:hypothetical protein
MKRTIDGDPKARFAACPRVLASLLGLLLIGAGEGARA